MVYLSFCYFSFPRRPPSQPPPTTPHNLTRLLPKSAAQCRLGPLCYCAELDSLISGCATFFFPSLSFHFLCHTNGQSPMVPNRPCSARCLPSCSLSHTGSGLTFAAN